MMQLFVNVLFWWESYANVFAHVKDILSHDLLDVLMVQSLRKI